MTYKDMVVHIDATPQGSARLKLAANVAHAHQAYLIELSSKSGQFRRFRSSFPG